MRPLLRRVPQIHRLAVFDAVASAGGITAGARMLEVTQPAVSRHMKALARDLGVALFERNGRDFDLTVEGRRLAEALDAAFAMIERALDEVTPHATLVFAVQPSMATSWVVPMLDELEAAVGADIRLMFYDRRSELDRGTWDLAIVPGRADGLPASWNTTTLFHEEVRPFAAPRVAERLALGTQSTASDLIEAPLLHVDDVDRPSMTWSDWFRAAGAAHVPKPRQLYSTYPMVLQEALAGNGVMLGWRHLLSDLVERSLLLPVGPAVERSDVGHYVCWPHHRADDRLATIRARLVAAIGHGPSPGFD